MSDKNQKTPEIIQKSMQTVVVDDPESDNENEPTDLISVSASEIHNLVEQTKKDRNIFIEKIMKLKKQIAIKDKIIENNLSMIDLLQSEIIRLNKK